MKKMSKLDIMNTMGNAADLKSRMNSNPEDEEDPLNSMNPKATKSPASTNGKQIAAIKSKAGKFGAKIPNGNNGQV